MPPLRFELRDGTKVVIRPIDPNDKGRLGDGHRRLSERTIRQRYLASKPALTAAELRYLTEVDGHDHIAFVAVLVEDPERLVGVARCVRLLGRPDTAEMAIVVTDPLQGLGLGRRLAQVLADAARAAGIRRFTATTAGENVGVQRVMATITQRLEGHWAGGGIRELAGDLRP